MQLDVIEKSKTKSFKDLDPGTVFLYQDQVYIKSSEIAEAFCILDVSNMAWKICAFHSHEDVLPLKAVLSYEK